MDMDMANMIPAWWTPAAWTYLIACLISAGVLAAGIYRRGLRQPLRMIELMWIVSALFLGPVALLMYARWGHPEGQAPGAIQHPRWVAVILTLLPGAAASTMAHLIGVPVVFSAGWTIAGQALWAVALFILVLATLLLFMYESATTSRHRAARPAALFFGALVTVLAFDVGMVGWMLYLHTNGLMRPITDVVFTAQMQIGMLLGMLTAWPIAARLTPRLPAGIGAEADHSPT
ncbi:DUF4396 domain-containing protein [Deinococcus peraridilitoris]|uniref:DUF4396 domain-containing protein n=1 Tax=Deinococcus peraridilitoris (strain DSM 19664 / LMG 22246 / CIP 109416 / KR-200) TaxID=937777 RepID=L0A3A3_DEIPD|nr:DUF4396 domain-containing protein [Deinococcus peraridilitoris]AFZ68378.1 hypothetical protein Deipe_2920 [Deinococcus peraridilitoris DSM 19664]